jgi:hypothetical protein
LRAIARGYGGNYSARDFFREMPNRLLARYFEARNVLSELDFTGMKEAQTDALFEAWLRMASGSFKRGVSFARRELGEPKAALGVR